MFVFLHLLGHILYCFPKVSDHGLAFLHIFPHVIQFCYQFLLALLIELGRKRLIRWTSVKCFKWLRLVSRVRPILSVSAGIAWSWYRVIIVDINILICSLILMLLMRRLAAGRDFWNLECWIDVWQLRETAADVVLGLLICVVGKVVQDLLGQVIDLTDNLDLVEFFVVDIEF